MLLHWRRLLYGAGLPVFFRSNLRCPSRLDNCSGDQRFATLAHAQFWLDTNADVPNKERSGLNAFNDLIPD